MNHRLQLIMRQYWIINHNEGSLGMQYVNKGTVHGGETAHGDRALYCSRCRGWNAAFFCKPKAALKMKSRTSLVAQWLRICLPVQVPGFNPWSGRSHMLQSN